VPQNHNLNIPASGNLTGVSINDTVTISFTDDRDFCFSDPNNVFANGFLPAGQRSKNYQSPAYTAVNAGTVTFNSVGWGGSCSPHGGIELTSHTIVVSGTGTL
jgi:hypothetical protein